jgi:hypothetical protein
MNIFRTALFRAIALALALPLSAVLVGCEMGSVDSTSAVLSDNSGTIYNFAGLYMNPNNSTSTNGLMPLVYPNDPRNRPSGQLIVSLRLLQYGEVLEAYDSAGLTWLGSITSIQSGSANFSLRGRTTAGMSTEIAGTLVYANQQSTMDATWIEPAFYGSLFAKATVSPATTNTPPVTEFSVTASPTSVSLSGSSAITASGGTGSYIWPSTVSFGTISSSGNPRTYTRTSGTTSNNAVISVTSGTETKSVTITFN